MNIIYIFGTTILLTAGTDSLIEDSKTDNNQQRILLRKLQNFQVAKPSAWNEVLADVLVNKIKIFSYKNENKDIDVNDYAPSEMTMLTNFFSKVFTVYKKFIYDAFVGKRKEDEYSVNEVQLDSKSTEKGVRRDLEDVITPTEVTFVEGPKGEIELVDPKYHGKITLEETSTEPPDYIVDLISKNSTEQNQDTELHNINDTTNADINTVTTANPINVKTEDINKEESVVNCAEGFVKSGSGNCVTNSSRLILAVPHQCPVGYKKDRFGWCRILFNF